MTEQRHNSLLDHALIQFDQALRTVWSDHYPARRQNPGAEHPAGEMDDTQRRHAAGLMRINHTGEVCAQALYFGQFATASDTRVARQMRQAADEETDHLAWCAERLDELHARPSLFNPLWYAGAFALGAAAGAAGDRLSLGFVVETEKQVEAHLGEHLQQLVPGDARSQAILEQMRSDEAAHAERARDAGDVVLPSPIRRAMAAMSATMKWIAYRV